MYPFHKIKELLFSVPIDGLIIRLWLSLGTQYHRSRLDRYLLAFVSFFENFVVNFPSRHGLIIQNMMVVHFHEWKYNLQYLEENGYKGTSFITLMVIYSSLTLSFNHHNYDESVIN